MHGTIGGTCARNMRITLEHRSEESWKRGGRIGTFAGILLFVGPGIVPSLFLGSYGMAVLLERAGGGAYQPDTVFRVVFVMGTAVTVSLIGTLMAVGGAALGAVGAYAFQWVRELLGLGMYEAGGVPRTLHMNDHPRMSATERQKILKRLAFLSPVMKDIRSLVVIGSAAYEGRVAGSDIDIVAICRETASGPVREFVFGLEIDDAMAEGLLTADLEFTILSETEAGHFFEAGSPFAYAIRHGVWLEDDGFLGERLNSFPVTRPGPEFQLALFHDNVAVQYLGSVAALKTEAGLKRCSEACCRSRSDCDGISPADAFCRTIMRMLYMVLPARGYMPLTKNDTVEFAGLVYGEDVIDIMKTAISVLRSGKNSITFLEYRPLKRFATILFRDVLALVEKGDEARRILHDARSLVRGHYADIQGGAMRNCVM